MELLKQVLKKEFLDIDFKQSLVLNLVSSSDSSVFYNEMYKEETALKTHPDLFLKNKEFHQNKGEAYTQMDKIIKLIKKNINDDAVVVEIGGSVYQKRSADAYNRFKNYFPLDISVSSMQRYSNKYNRPSIAADATNLPFKDNSIDCIFTHTFLEHPLQPEKVLEEIARVLKPNGIIIHNDAWFCRWWQRYGVVGLKSFGTMTMREKIIFFASKITEFPLFRIPPIVLKRLFKHMSVSTGKPIFLHYKKLKPNYDLQIAADEDAASTIDPLDVIRFYESRDFKLVNKLSLKQRLFYPNKYICLIKNNNH